MPDDDRMQHDETQGKEPGNPELPASVIFMEMMRRAAARPPSESDQPGEAQPDVPDQSVAAQGQSAPAATEQPVEHASQQRYEAAMEAQRIRRVKRRRARRRRRTVGVLGGFFRTILVVTVAAGLMATIFSFWTDPKYFKLDVRTELQVALATSQVTAQPTGIPTPPWLRRIGIVSGHRGPENDPGAVCPDGLIERDVNFNVAQLVVRNLRGRGYSVDLLDEFDPRLNDYQAAALVSIHSNTCQDFGERVSGFLVAKALSRPEGGEDVKLAECIAEHYAQATGLERRENLTIDMTDYHTFREINPLTPAAIIELGFLLADRSLLADQPDRLARGITDGILCFLEPGTSPETPTPEPPG